MTIAAPTNVTEVEWSARTCFVPVPLDVSRRRVRLPRSTARLVRQLHCEQGLPVLIGDAELPAGSRVAVVASGDLDRNDLSTIVAIADELGWQLEAVGIAVSGDEPAWSFPDVLESSAARSMAHAIADATGVTPPWDVAHGTTRLSALRSYVASARPDALVVPHGRHDSGGSCGSWALAGRLGVPVLLS